MIKNKKHPVIGKPIMELSTETKTISRELEQEINEKIIILHGNKDQVILPLYLWNKVVKKLYGY